MPVDTRLTYEDLCLLPNDGKRHEIIDGEHFVTPAPLTLHQRVVTRLAGYFFVFLDTHRLGEVFVSPFDVVFSRFDTVEPDLVYISRERSGILTRKNVQGAPDLVVEVLSESTADIDRTIKLKLYSRFGVREYWVIDPEKPSAEIYRATEKGLELSENSNADDSLTSPLLPGFSVSLRKLVE
jgi:Uma2 family endonuclease